MGAWRTRSCFVLLVLLLLQSSLVFPAAGYNLLILHTNDFHDRIEETNKYSGRCSAEDSAGGKCFGGAARLKYKVDELKAQYPNTLLLDAGDQFQGTLWYYRFGGSLIATFMNRIGFDAMGLGNHEFDNGVSGLAAFVNNATFKVLSSNINLTNTPDLQGKIHKSATFNIGGEDIGVIGYTTSETPYISNPETVTFNKELESIQAEADRLTALGVNKIIAVGHQGFTGDVEIARSLRNVDVIVGGHSNTFLYNGDPPSNEDPSDGYPVVVQTSKTGESVLVVQDYAFGKYLGNLHLTFDDEGKVTNFSGNPILLDSSVPQDSEIETLIESYLPTINGLQTEKISYSHVFLEGDRKVCRIQECNLGNLIADAMLKQNLRHSDSQYWSDVGIAVMNSGGIRASLPIGDITYGDAIKVQPFRNTIDIIEVTGESVLKILERCASGWTTDEDNLFGGFLQVAGMQIVYDMTKQVGSRVVDVQMICAKCYIPQFQPLNRTEVYQILINSFLADGGDGYTELPSVILKRHIIGISKQ
ncbi:5'-nucleotidase [Plakobranchus ocellatus]|uniref:5'-nucleotidase n=1 Tax=Plakobranchus ocellatus TaxID=259542 RepID=A0AAV3YGW4_9GAST|nr:5'-nucleotidase [Plakobranchus ocellatus]